jgi:hypothetical protein
MGEAKRKHEATKAVTPPPSAATPDLGWADAEMMLLSADAFRACASPFRENLLPHKKGAVLTKAQHDRGGAVASAVNLAFSIELYLKALRAIHGRPMRRGHDLDGLYMDLPGKLRTSIEAQYKMVAKNTSRDQVLSFGFSISHKSATLAERLAKPKGPTDHSVEAVLKRSRRLFEMWRYLYEQGEPGAIVRTSYEFYFLGVLAEILHDNAKRGLAEWLARELAQRR